MHTYIYSVITQYTGDFVIPYYFCSNHQTNSDVGSEFVGSSEITCVANLKLTQ